MKGKSAGGFNLRKELSATMDFREWDNELSQERVHQLVIQHQIGISENIHNINIIQTGWAVLICLVIYMHRCLRGERERQRERNNF